jgi:hypothetical protein
MTDFALNQTMGGPIQPASRPNLDKGFKGPIFSMSLAHPAAYRIRTIQADFRGSAMPPCSGSQAR